ncbi:MAG: hypothetical protein O3C40_27340 [Planctomycetota bacterium]|nr:hypothetical protein [Planctomycetota bacterium]
MTTMAVNKKSKADRGGVTLVELLVVVTIAVMLVATAVPLMKPAMKDGQLREAARQINAVFAVAKSRGIHHGRGAGVMIQRSQPGSNAAFELFIAETPPPYAGDIIGAVATLKDYKDTAGNSTPDGNFETAEFLDGNSATLAKLVQVGDLVQFNYQGPWYEITAVAETPVMLVRFQPKSASSNAWPSATATVPYKIARHPRKSSGAPLQFSGGVVIDLEYSGIGASGQQFNAALTNNTTASPPILNNQPILIMFNGSGALSRIYGSAILVSTSPATYAIPGNGVAPTGTVHLLVGRFEQTGALAEVTNLQDPKNVWISIGDRTGTVTSAANLTASSVAEARELARSGQSMGGI